VINIKKKIFFILKSTLSIILLLTLVLFFYAAFFYKSPTNEVKILENETINEEIEKELKEEKKVEKIEEISQPKEVIKEPEVDQKNNIEQVEKSIKDSLFATVGNKAVTRSDIVNEIKIILVLNGQIFSPEQKDILQAAAIKSLIKRTIKQIEIEKYDYLNYNNTDFNNELEQLSANISTDVEGLKSIFAANEIDFSIVENQVKIELMWNSLIFDIYKNRISINQSEIEEQLAAIQNSDTENVNEYLMSEILIKPVPTEELKSKIIEIKKRIISEGFDKVAMDISISKTGINGGDLGWVNQNIVSKDFLSKIENTPLGKVSEPILLSQGILIFMVRDKRLAEQITDLEKVKNQLVNKEKAKILSMYSLSHFDNIRRSISINYF